MKTNLFFVRHAHSTYTTDELGRPLSERGFIDAEAVTEVLKTENIEHVISSPYKRAIQTVEGIASYINTEIEIVDGFKERTLSEESVDSFTDAITKVWEDPTFSWEGGESNLIAQKRGIEITFQTLEKYEGKNVVIGTHGNIMVLIMNHFDKKFDFTFWQELEMPDIYKLTFEIKNLVEVKRIWNRIDRGVSHDQTRTN
ncbi:histidine phosphatase family protein [Lederbergia citrea]|uniref:Histidine phosphatase family protein n=2 Tax=Lederbergia citrea TaxID=2833581 RepID=A0A942URB3_9BACI|nr:histidine phosphatase family protein [Lederbergia citrea]MBS4223601.1 histidine phosphatase family protein [Lederbergia citrea]